MRPGPQRGQPCAAVAAVVPQARCAGLPAARRGGLWRPSLQLSTAAPAQLRPGQRPRAGRRTAGRAGGDPGAEHPRDAGGALRRTRCRGGPGVHQYPPGGTQHRVHPASLRSQGADLRP
ncbi:Uncharacterized protein APZ42_002805 [Daphnia magna]|uniref:Uncharacterized protein n=1 Tax=Daphnia magna TaxID=35525 RepID=A0A164I139_9CRUS|nr:Uncharacterized protein APZ42_002805 [Daphnia magna]